jgi:hypothetical protein
MKAIRYTTSTLIALMIATSSIQAQSARRSASDEKKVQTTQRTHTSQNVRKAPARQATSQKARTTQTARKVQPTQRTHTSQNVRKAPARQPVSMTTTKNPRSTYRKSNNRVTATPRNDKVARSTKYREARYYGGHHYHYAYPTRNVKFHYHHDTYVNHFRVLY